MILHLLSVLALQVQAYGLHPGERFEELAPAPPALEGEAPGHGNGHGRVVDAFTGRPIFGASVEIWTEEIDRTFGGFHRIGEARTGTDGHFGIRRWSGSHTGGKMRVRAPGYLTLSATDGDIWDTIRLFPAGDEPFRLRVLDSRGRPIPGAQITSTYSCSHDVPAFEVHTDARGLAVCGELGLQEDVPELRVRARGYGAIEYLYVEDALARVDRSEPLTVTLPRRRPFAARLLGRDGRPLAGVPVHAIDGECYHVLRTDETGLVQVESRYDCGKLNLQLLESPQNRYVAYFTPPRERVVTLRPDAEDWPEEIPVGEVRIDWGGRDPEVEDASVQLHHEDGWTWDFERRPSEEPAEFPCGRGFLVLGGAFSGHEEEVHDFELEPGGEVVIRPAFEREPRVTLLMPESFDEIWTWFEAGDETTVEFPIGSPFAVPGGRPLCVFAEGEAYDLRLRVEEARDGLVMDLARAEVLTPVADPLAPEVVRELVFLGAKGAELSGELELRGGHPDCSIVPGEDSLASRFLLRGPLGAPWLARFCADGHQTIWLRERIAEGDEPIQRVLLPSASLRIEAPFDFEVLGYDDEDLEGLPPGPTRLVLERPDGRRFGLDLLLQLGAERVISLR